MEIDSEVKLEKEYLEFCQNRKDYLKRQEIKLNDKIIGLSEDEYFSKIHLDHELDEINNEIKYCIQRINNLEKFGVALPEFNSR